MYFQLFLIFLTFEGFMFAEETCNTTACKLASVSILSQLNRTFDPCTDFYSHVCGNYPAHHPLDNNEWTNSFSERQKLVIKEIDEAFLNAKSKSKSKSIHFVSEYYSDCMNAQGMNDRGTAPLLDYIESVIGAWPMIRKPKKHVEKKWTDLFADVYSKAGLSYIIQVNNDSHSIMFEPGPLTLNPRVTRHLLPSVNSNETVIQSYRQFLNNVSAVLESANNSEAIEQVIHFQLKLEKVYELYKNNTALNISNLGKISAETIDWLSIMNRILAQFHSSAPKYTSTTKAAAQTKYLNSVIEVLNTTPVDVIQNFYGVAILLNYGPLTTDALRRAQSDFDGEKIYLNITNVCPFLLSAWPLLMGRMYIDTHFSLEEKTKATNMVNEIRSSFRINLQTNNWLDSETAKHAIEKLDAIQHFVGFDEWILSDELIDKHSNVIQNNETYQKGKFLETFINFSVRSRKDNLENHPPYQDPKLRDFVNPLIVNAFYSRSINSIFIPAAILQPPFFDHELPWSANYGSIGAIIGHELTHGFDAEGRKYDLHGNFSNWWTNATLTKFLNKTKCIQEQYGQIHDPVADKNINGVQTLSENIADNGAIKNSYAAYQAHLKKYKDAKVLPNLSYNSEQLFFVFYGNLWCENISAKRLRALIGGDGHSPNKYRTNVVLGNFEPFAKAFNCPLGSKMNPTSKCSVW